MDKKAIPVLSAAVLLLTLVVVIAGFYIVSFFSMGSIPAGVKVGDLEIGGLTLKDTNKKIEEYFPDYIKKRTVTISIDGKTFIIAMKDINVQLDKEGTLKKILGKSNYEKTKTSIKGMFENKPKQFAPVFQCDEKLLALKIYEIKGKADRGQMDANVILKDENIEKKPELMGVELSVENASKTIKNQLSMGNIGPIILNPGINEDFRLITPRVTMAKIEDINAIIGRGSTLIEDEDRLESIRLSAKAINGLFIPKLDKTKASEFSFYASLENDGFKLTKYNPAVNQVASTLYNALIKTGFSTKDVDIIADLESQAYSPNIKRIKVTGSVSDFKFRNNTEAPMIIKSVVQDRKVTVFILGKKKE